MPERTIIKKPKGFLLLYYAVFGVIASTLILATTEIFVGYQKSAKDELSKIECMSENMTVVEELRQLYWENEDIDEIANFSRQTGLVESEVTHCIPLGLGNGVPAEVDGKQIYDGELLPFNAGEFGEETLVYKVTVETKHIRNFNRGFRTSIFLAGRGDT